MDHDEHSDDDSRRHPRTPFVPPESWIDAFDAQCTEIVLKRLRRYAASLARVLGANSLGNDYAEELVQNALTDTLHGVLRRDPDASELEPYLLDVIRLRARRDRKRAERHELVSIDASDPDEPSSASELAHVEASLAMDVSCYPGESADSAAAAMTRMMSELRTLAEGDLLVQRFLDATEQDATTRPEIMQLARLTKLEYHNTRRRLARLVAQLRPEAGTSTKED